MFYNIRRSTMGITIGDVSIYKRGRKEYNGVKRKPSWYCQLRNPLTGQFPGGRTYSVTKLAKQLGYRNTFKLNGTDAKNIVQEAISKGLIKGVSQYEVDGSLSPLIPYVEKILNYDESPWVQSENRRKIDRLSRANVKNMESAFRLHAKPHIDPKTTIIGFSKLDAQKLQDKMHEAGASPDNINMAIKAMRTAYNFAVQTDIVDFNPFSYVKPYSVKRREREILSRAEAKQVLEFMQIFAQESPSRHVAYLAAKLAVYGGMRESEIRVFSLNKLKRVMNDAGEPTPFYKVDVSESWVDAEKDIGPTKERYKRTTVIHEDLVKELIAFAEKYGRSESDLLFASFTKGKSSQPYVKNIFQDYFYDALEAMGISNEIRMSRHIDFQSLRHFHDSESKASAERLEPYKAEIRAAIGHKSKTVDELIYTHDTPTSLVTLGVMSKHILDTK